MYSHERAFASQRRCRGHRSTGQCADAAQYMPTRTRNMHVGRLLCECVCVPLCTCSATRCIPADCETHVRDFRLTRDACLIWCSWFGAAGALLKRLNANSHARPSDQPSRPPAEQQQQRRQHRTGCHEPVFSEHVARAPALVGQPVSQREPMKTML